MPHSSQDPEHKKKDIHAGLVLLCLLISALVIVLIFVGLDQFYVSTHEKIYYEHVLAPISPQLTEVRAKEQEKLNRYELIDEETKRFRIPIDHAIQLLVNEATQKKGKWAP